MADITAKEFIDASRAAKQAIIDGARSSGPVYQGANPTPLIWQDQFFGRELSPAGTLDISVFTPLRLGATQGSIDLAVIASHANTGPMACPEGSKVTVELFEADANYTDSTDFETSGQSMTVTLVKTKLVWPDRQICRIHIGNMSKPWILPKITFTGVFEGGTVDVGLVYTAR